MSDAATVALVARLQAERDALLAAKWVSSGDAVQEATARAVKAEAALAERDAEVALQKGANVAQDEREQKAAERLGMVHSCDWPDDVAEELLVLRAKLQQCEAALREAIARWDDFNDPAQARSVNENAAAFHEAMDAVRAALTPATPRPEMSSVDAVDRADALMAETPATPRDPEGE